MKKFLLGGLRNIGSILALCLFMVVAVKTVAQPCDPSTPSFTVNLTNNADSFWISANTVRQGNCCGSSGARCIEFNVTLNPNASGIELGFYTGAVPSGSLNYQIGCSGSYAVGDVICLSGPGPHRITFCKPGSNTNRYYLKSIPKPSTSGNTIVSEACSKILKAYGLKEDSISWRSIPPNPAYDALLNCNWGCDSVVVSSNGTLPAYIDYEVCGPVSGNCAGTYFCDTIRVRFVSSLAVEILPSEPYICVGDTAVRITANVTGGLRPYTYQWSNGKTDSSIMAKLGTQIVTVRDSMNCTVARDTVVVTSYLLPTRAMAGNDTAICATLNTVQLNGKIQSARGGLWTSTGSGRFLPDDTTLNGTYVPSQAEIDAGFTTLYLTTRGTGSCLPHTDTLRVTINPAPDPVMSGPMDLCEFTNGYPYTVPNVPGDTYEWHVVGGTIASGQGTNTINVNWGAAGPGYIYMIQTAPTGCQGLASILPISRFDFNTNPITQATVGPDAISYDSDAYSNGYGYRITQNCGGAKGADLVVPGSTFDRGKMCMTFSFQRDENEAEFFTRGGTRFYLTGGKLSIVMRVSDGAGGYTDVGPLFTGYSLPQDDQFRYYTFCYDSSSGVARVLVNDSIVWGFQSTPNRSLYWNGSGDARMNTIMDGNCSLRPLMDFLNIAVPISIAPRPKPVISGPSPVCAYTSNHKYYVTKDSTTLISDFTWSVTGGTITSGQGTDTIRVAWNGAGTGTVTLTQTYVASGCDSTISINVTIRPKPTPVITGPDSICANSVATYSVTAAAGNTYAWQVTGGTIVGSSTNSSVQISWGAVGTGTLRVTQRNTFNCDSTVTRNITKLRVPAPVIAGPDSICHNKVYTYSITAFAGDTYSWQVTGGSIIGSSTASSVQVQWGVPGTGTITVTQSSGGSCDSTRSRNIRIFRTPAPVITGPDSTCQNEAYTFSVTPFAGDTYMWQVTGGTIIGASNASSVLVRWGVPGAGTVKITQTSSLGCDSSATANITILRTPVPSITGPDSTCQNKQYSYSAGLSTPGDTYLWQVIGGTIIGPNNGSTVQVAWGLPGAGTVRLTQTSDLGCDSVVNKAVTVVRTPAPVITGPDSTCHDRTYTFSVAAVAGDTYVWQVTGGVIIGASNTSSIQVLWGTPGLGSVQVTQTSSFGCDSTVQQAITILRTPAPVISGPDSTCQNKIYTYSVPMVIGDTYAWQITGGTIIGAANSNAVQVAMGMPGTATIRVTQTSAFGCDSTIAKQLTVMPTPAPVITGPDSTCEDRTYTYSVAAVAGHTYSWQVTGGTIIGISTSNSIQVTWAAAGTGTIGVTQVSAFGCDSMVSRTIQIFRTPTPAIGGADSTCQDKVYTYTVPAFPGDTYSWVVMGGTIVGPTSSNTVQVRWGLPGTGSLSVTQTSMLGCDSTVSLSGITIMRTPAPVITGPDSGCQNKQYVYSVPAVPGDTYAWQVNGGTIVSSATANSITVAWGMPGTGSVTVTQTSAFGCDSTVSATGITILRTPAPVITGPDSGCQNKQYVYSVPAVPGDTYSWQVNGGTIVGSATNNTVTVAWGLPGTGSVTVTQTSAFGCDSTVSATGITILRTPAPVITAPDSGCQNKQYVYSVPAVAGDTYSWQVNGGTIVGSATNNTVTVAWGLPGTGSVTVTQTSAFGCDSTVSATGITILRTPAPVITGPDSGCQNKQYVYSVPAVAGDTYAWQVNGGTIVGSATNNTVTVAWGMPGTGSVTITQTSAFGCDSTVSATGITILRTPAPVITGPDSGCQNKQYVYSVPAVAGDTYAWQVNGGTIVGSATNNTVTVAWGLPGTGSVTVTQTSAFGCDSTVSATGITILRTPAPVITGPDSGCQNKQYVYSVPAVPGDTYSWQVTGGTIVSSSTANSITVAWGMPGIGSVTITQTSAFGCDSTVSATGITILRTPAPVITGPDSTCENKQYVYSVPAVAGDTYSWQVAGGTIVGSATSNTVTVAWGVPGTGKIIVTQTSAFGCDSSVQRTDILILRTPAPVITGPDSGCQNKQYVYSVPAVSGDTYAWQVTGGTIVSSATANSITVAWGIPGTGSVTVTQTSDFGCDSTVSATGITILRTPAPVITGPDSGCQNKQYVYSVPAVAGDTYAWQVNGGTIVGSATNNSVTIAWGLPGTGSVTVTQTSAFGCDSTVSATGITILRTPAPVITGPDSGCQNKQYVYSVPAVPGDTYAWQVTGGTIVSSATANSITVAWGLPGTGSVTVTQTSAFGCDSTVSATGITILRTPAPVITGPDSGCQNKRYIYSVPAVAGDSYTWQISGGFVIGSATDPTVEVVWDLPGTGSVTVTQTSAFGCDSTVSVTGIVILRTPAPVITGPDSGCQNKQYVYSVPAVPGDTYNWQVNGGTIVGSATNNSVTIAWGLPGTGSVTVTQTSAFGCDSTVSATGITILRTPAPVITGPDSGCQNKQYVYSVPAVPGDTYSWQVTGGTIVSSATANSITVAWGMPGTGSVTITQTSAFGCDSTVSATGITILRTPAPVITGSDSGCQNKQYVYSVPAVPGDTYAWQVNGGTIIGSATNNTVTVAWGLPGTGSVTVTQTSAFGCDSTVSATGITILRTPAPVITGPDSGCQNKQYVYSVPAVAGDTYSWQVNGGTIVGSATNNSVTIAWGLPGTGSVTITQTSAFGCDSTVSATGITILRTPAPVITGPDSGCQNKQYVYSVPAVPGDTYAWQVNGGTIVGSATNNTVTVAWGLPGTGSVTVTQTSAFGCDSTVSATGITILRTPAPVITGPDSGCQNKQYVYSVPAVAGDTYSWQVTGGTIVSSATANSITVAWGLPGTGSVTVTQTSAFGCDSTVSATGITILRTPAPVITGPDSGCQNKQYVYSVPAVPGDTYSWQVTGGTIVSSATANSITVAWGLPGTGSVTITQTSAFGCDSTVSATGITILRTPAPVITGPDSGCQNKQYVYSVPAVPGDTYSWQVTGGTIVGSATNNSVTIAWGLPGTGSVTVTQTSAFGCDSTVNATGITILRTPAPVITGPDSGCQNKQYVYSVPAVAGDTYSWQVTGGTIVSSATANSITVAWGLPGTGSVTVTQTSAFGCDSTVSATGITILRTPAPVITGPDSGCQNKQYVYSVPAVPGDTYAWQVTGGTIVSSATANSITVAWGMPGTGSVTVTQTSAFGCDSTVSATGIVILRTPAPVITGPDSGCQNKQYVYSVPAVAGDTYAWQVAGGTIVGSATSNTVTVAWGVPGTGKVIVTQTSAFGCDSSVQRTDIVILRTPAPVITGPDSGCQNKQYVYSVPAVPGDTYAWQVTGGTIVGSATNNSVTIAWGLPGTGSVTVTQTSAFGCDSTVSATGITILRTPAPVITGPDSGCQNKQYVYSVPAVAGDTYSWQVTGGTIVSSATANSITVAWGLPGTGSVTVTQTSAFGCDSTVTKSAVQIMRTPAPVIAGLDSVCQNKKYIYSVPAVAGDTYAWQVTGGTIVGASNSNSITVAWGLPGTGSVSVTQTSSFGCDSTVSRNSIRILRTPAPVITGPDSVCQNKKYFYSVPAVAGDTYSWQVTGGTIVGSSTSNTVQIAWGLPGAATVKVTQTSVFGCDSSVTRTDIRVQRTPAPVIAGADSVCHNRKYVYAVPAVAGDTYAWQVTGGAILGSATSNTITILWGTPGTGSVTVTQTSSFGCDSTVSKNTIRILRTPAPVITGPDSTCEDRVYTYAVTAVSTDSYSWQVNGGTIVGTTTGNSIQVLWGSPGVGTIRLTQTTSFGCDSAVVRSVQILRTPKPVITGLDSGCQNKKYVYSVPAVAGDNYAWQVTGGTIVGSSTGNSITVAWGTPGTGTVTVTQTAPFGCDSTVRKNAIRILRTPAPVITGPDSGCHNKKYIYAVTPVAGDTYDWQVTGGTIVGSSTSNMVQVTWGIPGTGTIVLRQTSASGCDSTVIRQVRILRTPAPVLTGADTACHNRPYTYSVAAVAGDTYAWQVTSGSIIGLSTGNAVTVVWSGPGTGTITVTQTSSSGCDSLVSASVNIQRTPAPVITGPDSTCQNKKYTYAVIAVPGDTYNWQVTGGTIVGSSTGNSIQVAWGLPGTGSVRVTQTSNWGCDSMVQRTIRIMRTPAPVITGLDSGCQNKKYVYSVPAVGGDTYAWQVTGGVIVGSSTSNSITVAWGVPGTGSVRITQYSAFGCDSTVTKNNIRILRTPAPVITGPDTGCQNKKYVYSVPAVAGDAYAWQVNGGTIVGSATSNTVTVAWATPGLGWVQVTQTSSSGCDSLVRKGGIRILRTPAPVITGPDSICHNKQYTYSVNAFAGDKYAWQVTGGTIVGAATGNSIKVLWGLPGTGNVRVTQTSAFGCDSIVALNTTILRTPAPTINGPDTICFNKPYTFHSTAVYGDDLYQWQITGGTIVGSSTMANVTVVWNGVGTGTIQLRQSSRFGCDSTVSSSLTVMRTPAPVITGPDSGCQNKKYTYSVPAFTGDKYVWQVTGGTIIGADTGTSIQVAWGLPGNGSVRVTQTSDWGCDSTVARNIRIKRTPAPVISGPDSTCQNKKYVYSVPAVTGDTYAWQVTGGTIVGSSTNNTLTVAWGMPGIGTVTLTQTSSFGCDSTVTRSAIYIQRTPAPEITGADTTCQNKKYTYSVVAVPGDKYVWQITGGTIIGSFKKNYVTVVWGAPGIGSLTVTQTSSFGCDSTVSNTNIRIMRTPAPVIGGSDTVCFNRKYTYSVMSPIPGDTYSWTVSNGKILGSATGSSVQIIWGPAGNGQVNLRQTSGFGCDSLVSLRTIIRPTPGPVIQGTPVVCQNKRYFYKVTEVPGERYFWSVSGGVILGRTDSSQVEVAWGMPGTGVVTVTQVNNYGCDSTSRLTANIMLTPAPVILGPDTVCENQVYTYETAEIPGNTYTWGVIGGTILTNKNRPSIQVRWGASGTGRLVLIEATPISCDSLVSEYVHIKEAPTPVITGPDSTCLNRTYAYSVAFNNNHLYTWGVQGGTIVGSNTGNSITVTWTTEGEGKVWIKETNDLGCDVSVEYLVYVAPTPIPDLKGSLKGCAYSKGNPYKGNLYYTTVQKKPSVNYYWSTTPATVIHGNGNDSVAIDWGAPGMYRINLHIVNTHTGCQDSIAIMVEIGDMPKPEIDLADSSACAPFDMVLKAVTNMQDMQYDWYVEPGFRTTDPATNFTLKKPGSYRARLMVTNSYGCRDSAIMTLIAHPKPRMDFGWVNPDPIYIHDTVQFTNLSQGANAFRWDFHDGTSTTQFEPEKSYDEPGQYRVLLWGETQYGCQDSVEKYVNITVKPAIFAPTAFTINHDGLNETFHVTHYYITELEVTIYNRWGEKLFQSKDKNFQWDGTYMDKDVPEGVYVYEIVARGYNGERYILVSDVTLLR